MTLVLPGSAQIAAGNRRLGKLALRIWGGLGVTALALGVLALVWRSGFVSLLTYSPAMRLGQALLIVLGVGWGLLLFDAWRLAHPPELARRHRLGFAFLNIGIAVVVTASLVAAASVVSHQRDLVAAVFAGGGEAAPKNGRINILLLGGDAGKTRVGLRPDSITVASIDSDTGRTVLLSLPRNMEDVPFPAGSPMRAPFPAGFGCPDHSCMLNAVYTYATDNPDLYPGAKDPGAEATMEAVEGVTGLKMNYYVLVDLKGFESLVDAVGGINLDISKKVPIGGGSSKIRGYIEPGENVHLDGYHALWFARSRAESSDYERIARQKCVMSAMLNQLDPVTVVANFKTIATAGKEIMTTSVPPSQLGPLSDLALKAKQLPLSTVAFTPPLVFPGSPDFELIRRTVKSKITRAEAADTRQASGTSAPGDEPSTAPTNPPTDPSSPVSPSVANPSFTASPSPTPKPGMETEDLAEVCSAR